MSGMKVNRTIRIDDQHGSWIEVGYDDERAVLKTKRGQLVELASIMDVDAVVSVLQEARSRMTNAADSEAPTGIKLPEAVAEPVELASVKPAEVESLSPSEAGVQVDPGTPPAEPAGKVEPEVPAPVDPDAALDRLKGRARRS